MRNLVTGGAGFVGSHLINNLMINGEEVICLDNYITGQKKNVEIYKFRQYETIENRLEQIQNLKMDLTKKMISPTNRKFLETLI